ncbi:hypothetical protein ACF0H5_014507 [Mactra antiquata]
MHENMNISLLNAIKNGDQQSAKRIILQEKYTYIDKQNSKKDGTALFWSCCQGYYELVQLLLLRGADVNKCTAWGATSLHACADHDQVDILLLLIKYGADVNHQTNNGDTACHLASYRGYAECVQRLAERGANIEIRNSKRHTPIQEAYMRGHTEIYRYLLSVQKLIGCRQTNQTTTPTTKPYEHFTPAPPPRDFYGMSNDHNTVSSINLWSGSSSQSFTNVGRSNSTGKEVVRDPRTRNNVLGVLRLRNIEQENSLEDNNLSLDSFTGQNDLSFTSLNDLSSLDTSCSSSDSKLPERSMLSFKNI